MTIEKVTELLNEKLRTDRPGLTEIPEDKRHLFLGSLACDAIMDNLVARQDEGEFLIQGFWKCKNSKTGTRYFATVVDEQEWKRMLAAGEKDPRLQEWLDDTAAQIKIAHTGEAV
jgi:hypothetical protein